MLCRLAILSKSSLLWAPPSLPLSQQELKPPPAHRTSRPCVCQQPAHLLPLSPCRGALNYSLWRRRAGTPMLIKSRRSRLRVLPHTLIALLLCLEKGQHYLESLDSKIIRAQLNSSPYLPNKSVNQFKQNGNIGEFKMWVLVRVVLMRKKNDQLSHSAVAEYCQHKFPNLKHTAHQFWWEASAMNCSGLTQQM